MSETGNKTFRDKIFLQTAATYLQLKKFNQGRMILAVVICDLLPTSVASYLSWLELRTGIARSRVKIPFKFYFS